ncbi:ribonucleoside-triphosphate reductase [[Pantoea] beijingensis]|uniref:Ribose 1,5-bisphosphate phosphokinase PhnN n=1 Tax=[Pantoea] beijingensis TaxID=1324864 RepID=A0A443IDP0_9GAMM|nr:MULTISPECIES: ribose 1,5-bisphosphokinase [Erwiniaceae]RWR02249.1 ribonucleoside-triphosphate reductase [[Pantoea] beijingensis]
MARLIWLMGASGSGKDSLLTALREQAPEGILVAHRYITRPANAGGENHVALSEVEFLRRRAKGLFALDWQAHQHYYALGIEVDLWLEQGMDVVVNGSRQQLTAACQRYDGRILPICLQVSLPVLEQRLRQRGRESEGEIAQRLARAQEALPDRCLRLANDGALTQTLSQFRALLEREACN